MSTPTATTAPAPGTAPPGPAALDLGVLGDRQLLCVQLFDIARHPCAAVVLVPGCFIAATGKGPSDSNESGKTSWQASVALLLGDPEWRMHGAGAAAVAQLLFEPNTAGVAAQRYSAATSGYIAGLFADPDAIEDSAHTVWMRIGATAPYVQVRHAAGVHLATADDETQRHQDAAAIFRSLPGPALGATQYAERLYGPVPRCLAYLSSRGKRRGGPSLLKLDTGLFTPAGIGAALIDLTGRADLLDTDQEVRHDLAQALAELAERESQNAADLIGEEESLRAIARRDRSRTFLAQAQHAWHLHYARGLLDTLDKQAALNTQQAKDRTDLEDADQALRCAQRDAETLRERRTLDRDLRDADRAAQLAQQQWEAAQREETRLRTVRESLDEQIHTADTAAAGAHGDLDEATEAAQQARRHTIDCQTRLAAAQEARTHAAADLAQAENGHYGQAGHLVETLAAAKIPAQGLLDTLQLPAAQRARWEARLALYRDAVCIDTTHADQATAALADHPGAVLILCPTHSTATKPAFAPETLRPFLAALAARLNTTTAPVTAVDPDLGVRILGTFPHPLTGRTALLKRLRTALTTAEKNLQATQHDAARAHTIEEQAHTLVQQLQHAARAADLRRRRQHTEAELARCTAAMPPLDTRREQTSAAHHQLDVQKETLDLQREKAKTAVAQASSTADACRAQLSETTRALQALDLAYWQQGAGSREQAEQALHRTTATGEDAPAPERRTETTLREQAGRHLDLALTILDIDPSTGDGAPTPAIEQAVRLRANEATEDGTRHFPDASAFENPAGELHDWLQARADADRSAQTRIAADRETRQQRLAFSQDKTTHLQQSVQAMQDGIALRLDRALQDIEDALDRLNRKAGLYGAELRRTFIPPATLLDLWRCEITPCWRRTPTGPMLPYDNITNSAQEKLFSIHLVLAALLASPHPQGRVLILDELGDSLGYHHRREVLAALSAAAYDHGITVLGTCQETLMDDAADFCGEILYFHYPSHTEALNTPTRMFGYDADNDRVEITLQALLAGRTWW